MYPPIFTYQCAGGPRAMCGQRYVDNYIELCRQRTTALARHSSNLVLGFMIPPIVSEQQLTSDRFWDSHMTLYFGFDQ